MGGVTTHTCTNTPRAEPVANPQTGGAEPGWHVKLKIQDQDMLTWCIDQRLKPVLDRLVEWKLTLNLEKCLFSQSRLQYLGQIIDSEGIRKDPSKVKAIVDIAEPQDIASLRRFLGLVNHLMKFCPNLAEKTKPLRDLLKKESAWLWGPAQQKTFQQL